MQRYTRALGPGAVVFAGGASEKVRSALKGLGVAALDGSKLTTDGSLPGRFQIFFWNVFAKNQKKGRLECLDSCIFGVLIHVNPMVLGTIVNHGFWR